MTDKRKYTLVTGGSRGIGRAICIELALKGYHVLVNYRQGKDEADQTLEVIKASGGAGELIPFDVSDQAAVEHALKVWSQSHSGEYIEVLVNNAGVRQDNLMMWMQNEEWEKVLNTNLNGFFYVTRVLLKDMLVKRFGRIINISSLSGIKGLPGQTNYAAAKGGIIAATKALALEIARKGVTVNAVAPGFIRTEMLNGMSENDIKRSIPMARYGEPEEVAHLVGFLASKEAAYITGEVISINGGLYT